MLTTRAGAEATRRSRNPDGYLTYFPALEGYNTWGKTYEEAIKLAEETLTLYLELFDELCEIY